MRKILMIAFHYPPFGAGSGIQRTLKFSRYLPNLGWQPIILTANSKLYTDVRNDQVHEIPAGVTVRRAFGMDTARHLSVFGSYLRCLALPDRWVGWWTGAVPAGLNLIRQYQPDIIWSTYPIATAHLIGLTLHRLTRIPWITDFRDSMAEDDYPPDPLTRRTFRWIEKKIIQYSSRLIFTAPSTVQMYLNRYPKLQPERCVLIPNGYDEEDFINIVSAKPRRLIDDRPLRLIHAGLLYPNERNPKPFFQALSRLKKEGRVTSQSLKIELRASGSENYYSAILKDLAIEDLVFLLPALPYRDSLRECADADALLLFQAALCDHQIPAKVYEYLRIQRPILALTPNQGDTARVLQETGGATTVDLADEDAIVHTLTAFLSSVQNATHQLPDTGKIQRYARKNQAIEFARCLTEETVRHEQAKNIIKRFH